MLLHQMRSWAQHLGLQLFVPSPPTRDGAQFTYTPSWTAMAQGRKLMAGTEGLASNGGSAEAMLHILHGRLSASTVASQPRRLAWLVKLHFAIDIMVQEPLILPMEQVQATLHVTGLPGLMQLPSVFLQPPRKVYIPNASVRAQSASPLIVGTDQELIINGPGEFYLHASGGTPYLADETLGEAQVTVHMPLLQKRRTPMAIHFLPGRSTSEEYVWDLQTVLAS